VRDLASASANGIGFAARSAMLKQKTPIESLAILAVGTTSSKWAQTAVITGE
jgi:hypothetical protein